MVHILQDRFAWRAAAVALGSAALALSGFAQSPANAAYGPPPPPTTPPPGGFRNIVASETVDPGGGILGPFGVNGLQVTITVPRHAFPVPVQVTITAPDVSAIGNAGFRRYLALGGVGVLIQVNGTTYPGAFRRGVTLDMTSPGISRADLVVVWNGERFVIVGARERSDTEALRFYSEAEEDFAVLMPARLRHGGGAADAVRAVRMSADAVSAVTDAGFTAMFFRPGDSPEPGLGVLALGG
jgi:hypothetical protein